MMMPSLDHLSVWEFVREALQRMREAPGSRIVVASWADGSGLLESGANLAGIL